MIKITSKTQLSYTFQFSKNLVDSFTKELIKIEQQGVCSKNEFLNNLMQNNIITSKERVMNENLRMLEILGIIEKIDKDRIILRKDILKFRGEIGNYNFWKYLSDYMINTRYIQKFGYEFLDSHQDYLKKYDDKNYDKLRRYISKKIIDLSNNNQELEHQFSKLKINKEQWIVEKKAITCVISMFKIIYKERIGEVMKTNVAKDFMNVLMKTYEEIKKPNLNNVTIKELRERIKAKYAIDTVDFDKLLREHFFDSRLHFDSGKPHNLSITDGFKIKKLGGLETTYYMLSVRLK